MEAAAGRRLVQNTCPVLGNNGAKEITKADLAAPAPTSLFFIAELEV